MAEAKVIFTLDGVNTTIYCSPENKMRDICLKFATKIRINLNLFIFLYGGNQLNLELKFKEQANSSDKFSKEMRVLVYKNENTSLIYSNYGQKVRFNNKIIDELILSNNNVNDIINGIKFNIENILKISTVNTVNIQLKNINLLLNNINEDIKKNNDKLKVLLNYFNNGINKSMINNNISNNISKKPFNQDLIQNINNNEIIHKNIDFNSLYRRLNNSLNSLKHNNYDLPNIETIKKYIKSNYIYNLPIFIIETEKINYCLNNIEMIQNNMNYPPFFLSENDILSSDKLSENKRYSFINEDIAKYFNIHNLDNLPKAFLFINKKDLFIFYPKQNCLLKAINYINNSFNIKISIQKTNLQYLGNVKLSRYNFLDDNQYNQDVLNNNIPLIKSNYEKNNNDIVDSFSNDFGANKKFQQNNTGIINTITNAIGVEQNNMGIVKTIADAIRGDNNSTGIENSFSNDYGENQKFQQNNTGIINTITNAIRGDNNINNIQPSKIDTVTKIGKFIVENKEGLGNLIK